MIQRTRVIGFGADGVQQFDTRDSDPQTQAGPNPALAALAQVDPWAAMAKAVLTPEAPQKLTADRRAEALYVSGGTLLRRPK